MIIKVSTTSQYCLNCKNVTEHVYIGQQDWPPKNGVQRPSYELWNCRICQSTKSVEIKK